MADSSVYDFAFSFAGEHRAYVEATKNACENLGLKVFYDRDKNNEWWGKNFIVEQRRVYGAQTRYFVPFISVEYLAKPIPADEFQAAMLKAVERGDDYILPVLIGDVRVPSELLHRHTRVIRLKRRRSLLRPYSAVFNLLGSRACGQIVRRRFAVTLPGCESTMFGDCWPAFVVVASRTPSSGGSDWRSPPT